MFLTSLVASWVSHLLFKFSRKLLSALELVYSMYVYCKHMPITYKIDFTSENTCVLHNTLRIFLVGPNPNRQLLQMRESIISQKYCKRNYIISRPSLEFRAGIRPDPFFEVLFNIKEIRGDPLPNFQIQLTDRSIPEESGVCICIIRKYSDIT